MMQIIAVLLFAIVYGLAYEVVLFIYTTINNWRLSRIAKSLNLEFSRGKLSWFSFAISKPFELHGELNHRNIKIKQSIATASQALKPYTTVTVTAQNPSKGRLKLRQKGLFEKKHRYFGNQNDNRFIVASQPAAFGKFVLSDKLLKRLQSTQSFYYSLLNAFLSSGELVSISRKGEVKIVAEGVWATKRKILELLEIAQELADHIENFQKQSKDVI